MTIELPPIDERLSRIRTRWTLLDRAHGSRVADAVYARQLLVHRYSSAVYRYLLGAVRDEDAAGELFQEFALRILRGDFHRADRDRGRFRAYLKTALIHLIGDFRRSRGDARPLLFDPPAQEPREEPEDPDFAQAFRTDLMDRAWSSMREKHPVLHAVLLAHVRDAEITSQQVADEIVHRLGRKCTANHARVMLHRARAKFVDFLLDEVEQSIPNCTLDELSAELRELNLFKLCEPALSRRVAEEAVAQ